MATVPAYLVALQPVLPVYLSLIIKPAIPSKWSIRLRQPLLLKPVGAKAMVHALGRGSMLEGVTVVPL